MVMDVKWSCYGSISSGQVFLKFWRLLRVRRRWGAFWSIARPMVKADIFTICSSRFSWRVEDPRTILICSEPSQKQHQLSWDSTQTHTHTHHPNYVHTTFDITITVSDTCVNIFTLRSQKCNNLLLILFVHIFSTILFVQ